MNIPSWQEFTVYLHDVKKVKLPDTFNGRFEYIKRFFLGRPFNENSVKQMLSAIRQDHYYKRDAKTSVAEINEYILIIKLIVEYHSHIKQEAASSIEYMGVKMDVTWDKFRSYIYGQKGARGHERYWIGKFNEIQQFFYNKSFNQENISFFFIQLKERFRKEHGREIANAYFNKYLGILRAIDKLLKTNATSEFMSLKKTYKETEKVTPEEFRKLLTVDIPYKNTSIGAERNFLYKTILATLFITTARPSEILNLTWDDFVDNSFIFRMTKNGTSHKVFLPDSLVQDINKLPRYTHNRIFGTERGPVDRTTLNEQIRMRCEAVGITKNITARSMRKSGITAYLMKYDAHQVAKISNHQSIDILFKHYYKPEDDEIRNMVRHNEILPEDPSTEEFIEAYRRNTQRFARTKYHKIAQQVERQIVQQMERGVEGQGVIKNAPGNNL